MNTYYDNEMQARAQIRRRLEGASGPAGAERGVSSTFRVLHRHHRAVRRTR